MTYRPYKKPDDGMNAVQRYQAKCDSITIRPPKEFGIRIRSAAEADDVSVTAYIMRAITEYMENHPTETSAADNDNS